MTRTVAQIIGSALTEVNVIMAGGSVPANIGTFVLDKLQRLLDNWNAERAAVYAEEQHPFTLVPNLTPHTIGPTGTFPTTARPVSIEGASVVLNGAAPNANQALNIRDFQWWQAQIVPTVTATLPSDVYYQPGWPNGSLYFWPVPTVAYGMLLQYRVALDSGISLVSSLSLPQGYLDAIILTLTEEIVTGLGRAVPPQVATSARAARARIFGNNDVTPNIATADAGMPSGGASSGNRADFNWIYGRVE